MQARKTPFALNFQKYRTEVGTANQQIQTVIDAIKTNAAGTPCTIQFGNGTATLNIGDNYIIFDGGTSGTDWGLITLTGKITGELLPIPEKEALWFSTNPLER